MSEPHDETQKHVGESLACVRGHIRRVHEQIDSLLQAGVPPKKCPHCNEALPKETPDPVDVERLSRALVSLTEVERKLSGRPDPGHYKPQQAPDQRQDRLEHYMVEPL